MLERYRSDYPGEFVVTKTVFRNGTKEQEREWIDNPIQVTHTSGKAVCFAKSPYLRDTFYHRIVENRGGLLSREKMQSYGVDDVWSYAKPNFLVSTNREHLSAMAEAKYTEDVIVYTSATLCLEHPGEFFLIPYNFAANVYAQAAWLACFDEHSEVYLVGYDVTDEQGKPREKMVNAVAQVMLTYPQVRFTHVTNATPPDTWRRLLNYRNIPLETYISYCDI